MRMTLLFAGLCLTSTSAQGQQPAPLARLGPVARVTDSTLVLAASLATRSSPTLPKKPSLLGGVIGFVVGAAAGFTLGCLANKDDYGVFCGGQNDTKVFVGAAVGGVVGATVGALLFRRER